MVEHLDGVDGVKLINVEHRIDAGCCQSKKQAAFFAPAPITSSPGIQPGGSMRSLGQHVRYTPARASGSQESGKNLVNHPATPASG
jgi:hypothetical protein